MFIIQDLPTTTNGTGTGKQVRKSGGTGCISRSRNRCLALRSKRSFHEFPTAAGTSTSGSLRPRSHGIIIGLQGQANSFSGAKAARIATMTKCAEKANNDTVTDSLYGFEYSYDTTNHNNHNLHNHHNANTNNNNNNNNNNHQSKRIRRRTIIGTVLRLTIVLTMAVLTITSTMENEIEK